MKYLFSFVFVLIFSFFGNAKKFSTSYVSFDLLNNWNCYAEGTDWICGNKLNRKKASEAMIILTAKQKGPLDSMARYINYLKTPRTIKTRKNTQSTSKVIHSKQRMINKHMWVDGFHHGSEVPVYYSRYLVTIKGNLAILVSYSAHKKYYTKYAADFAASINSLKVLNVSSDFASGSRGAGSSGGLGNYIDNMIDPENELGEEGEEITDDEKGLLNLLKDPVALGCGLAVLSTLGYLFFKRRRRNASLRPSSGRSSSSSRKGSGSSSRRNQNNRSSSDKKRSSSSRHRSSRHRHK